MRFSFLSNSNGHGKDEGFGFWVAVAFTVNYIMGTGFLTLPWAFSKAGVALGIIVLFCMSFLCNITKDFVLEALARENVLRECEGRERAFQDFHGLEDGPPLQSPPDMGLESQRFMTPLLSSNTSQGEGLVGERQVEVPEVCEVFLGMKGRRIYTLLVSIYLYGSLWGYSSGLEHTM